MKDNNLRSVVEMVGDRTVLLNPAENYQPTREFGFDASIWSIPKTQKLVHTFKDTRRDTHESQFDVYNLVAKGVVEDAFDGYNSCIMTYGQTGSGKTYTMMGKYNPKVVVGGDGDEGVIPRVCCDLFDILERKNNEELVKPEAERIQYRVEVNFVEIYMEKVRDLLDPSLQSARGREVMTEARIRQDPESGPFVDGVTKYRVENWGHCCTLLERGSKHRTTCATLVHQQSSRSHAIFQITVVQQSVVPGKDRYTPSTTKVKAARINLVDLAGSERGGFTDYVKESAKINKSLLALRRVIDSLVERQRIMLEIAKAEIEGLPLPDKTLPQVPFRDSVLTWLLSDSIGGNARTTMVATLSPLEKNYNDTLATLTWSSKARNLVTVVKQNDTQSALSSKASELQSNLMIKQQNVDNLTQILRDKRDLSADLDKQTRSLERRIEKAQEHAATLENDAYAIRIQRFFRRCLHSTRMRKLNAEHKKQEGILASVRETRDGKQNDVNELKILEVQQQEDIADLKTSGQTTQATLRDHKQNKTAFAERKQKAEQEYSLLHGKLGEEQEQYAKEAKEYEDSNEAVRVTIKKAQERNVTLEREIKEMKSELGSKSKADYAKEIAAADAKLEELNRRLAEVKASHARVSQSHSTVAALHRKNFPKK